MEQLIPDVWVHRLDAEGFPTISAVVFTPTRAFVVDTLMRPQDMVPVQESWPRTPARGPPWS